MIDRYRLDADGNWISKSTGKPMETQGDFVPVPQVVRDTAPYISPITGKLVDGRKARREDLKRSGSREVDPSEYRPTYESKERAIKNGGEWEPRKAVDLGNGYVRGGTG